MTDPHFWRSRWQNGQTGWHRDDVNPLLVRFWPELGIADGTVFVPLCGASEDMLWLAEQGFDVVGIDVSELAIRQFFEHHQIDYEVSSAGCFKTFSAPRLRILVGDFFDLVPADLPVLAAVYDRASLIALPPELRDRYQAQFETLVPNTVPVLLITLEYAQQEMQGPPFSVLRDEVQRRYGQCRQVQQLDCRDASADEPGLIARGLSKLTECVFKL